MDKAKRSWFQALISIVKVRHHEPKSAKSDKAKHYLEMYKSGDRSKELQDKIRNLNK